MATLKVQFQIEYGASDGQTLYLVCGENGYPMRSSDNHNWSLEANLRSNVDYHYELRDSIGRTLRQEERGHDLKQASDDCTIYDRWYDTPINKPLYSSFFSECVFRRAEKGKTLSASEGFILLECEAPSLSRDETLAIVGSSPLLGKWEASSAIKMSYAGSCLWQALVPQETAWSEYKFIVLDGTNGHFKCFEEGENRLLTADNHSATIIRGLRLRDPRSAWKGAGVAIPLFSLRSDQSWGCGDFADLKLMAKWASKVGMSVIQILPINDTTATYTWRDSYPYNAISSFALNPIYINAEEAATYCKKIASAEKAELIDALLAKYSTSGAKLNRKSAVDYEGVILLKDRFLKALYRLCGEELCQTKAFLKFASENESWLKPYAIYCSLRDKFKTTDFTQWRILSHYDKAKAESYYKKNLERVNFYSFTQFLLDYQLLKVKAQAHRLGITLKGDIPIGVSPCSVDVWQSPELYNTSMSAGAPPDVFAEDGQNWGFPTYNWATMREDGYSWWRGRLGKMAKYFDAYRIDHILGFFRIWEVPRKAKSAILGHFNPSLPYSAEEIRALGFNFDKALHTSNDLDNTDVLFVSYPYKEDSYCPRIDATKTKLYATLSKEQQEAFCRIHDHFFYERHNAFWQECAMRRLPVLMEATQMLTCGEDLGMIPACVPQTMDQERILALEIERMPKQYGARFGDTTAYPYLSVAATSTHDMSTIRGWWREDRQLTQSYWSEVLGLSGQAEEECSAQTAKMILEREMRSGSMLAILPLQDWLAMDETLRLADPNAERINVPADPNHYWRYRMHLSLEQLLKENDFNLKVAELVKLRKQ